MEETLGSKLQSLREEKGISLEEVAQITKIKISSLMAIENNDYENLPSSIYTKSFIKNYANFLGLDGSACVKEYLASIPTPKAKDKIFSIQQPITYQRRADHRTRTRKLPVIIVTVIILALVAGGLYFWSYKTGKKLPFFKSSKSKTKTSAAKNPQAKYLFEFQDGTVQGKKVSIQALGNVFVRVKNADNVLFADVLSAGAHETWDAFDGMQIQISEAANVELFAGPTAVELPKNGTVLIGADNKGLLLGAGKKS